MMKILLLSQFFWPEVRTAPTNLAAMAHDLQARGHELLVITGFPNHPFGRIYDGYRLRPWQWDEVHGVKTLRLPLFPDHSMSAARRLLNYGSFALAASIFGPLFSQNFKPDVIFAYYAPLTIGVPALLLRQFHRVPVVYWVTDLWPENLRATHPTIKERTYRAIRRIEDWGYRQAVAICVDSPGFRKNLIEKEVPAEKIEVVAEWADETLFFPVAPDSALAQEFGLAGKFNIIYGGNLGSMQQLGTAVQAARRLQDLPDLQFVFIGDGNDLDNLKQQVKDLELDNVIFIPRQPPEEIHRFFALADALLVHLKRVPIFELQLPSKVLAYLACGRPILCAVPGAVTQIVQEAGAGVFCPSEDPEAMAHQARVLYSMSKESREAMGRRGRQAYLQKYTRAVQVQRIEDTLKRVVETSEFSPGKGMPQVISKNQFYQPVIIIGAARSGTNMLRDILTGIPGFGTWPCDEINYIWRHGNTTYPTDEFGIEQARPDVQAYIRRQFATLAQKQKLPFVVEKTCANSLRVAFVNHIFPNAKFIFIVRDGRDVTASAMKRWNAPLDLPYILKKARYVPVSDVPYYGLRYVWNHLYRLAAQKERLAYWGPRFAGMDDLLASRTLAEVCAAQWAVSVARAEQDLAALAPERVHCLRYEDFVAQPAAGLEQLAQFLAIRLEPGKIQQLTGTVSAGSVGQWQRQLEPATQQRISPLIQAELQRHGYI